MLAANVGLVRCCCLQHSSVGWLIRRSSCQIVRVLSKMHKSALLEQEVLVEVVLLLKHSHPPLEDILRHDVALDLFVVDGEDLLSVARDEVVQVLGDLLSIFLLEVRTDDFEQFVGLDDVFDLDDQLDFFEGVHFGVELESRVDDVAEVSRPSTLHEGSRSLSVVTSCRTAVSSSTDKLRLFLLLRDLSAGMGWVSVKVMREWLLGSRRVATKNSSTIVNCRGPVPAHTTMKGSASAIRIR